MTRRSALAALFLSPLLLAAIPGDLSFSPWFTSRGVSVEIARQPSGPPWIRGRGEIPAPASKVAAVLSDFGRYRELFSPAVKKADVLEREGAAARLHLVWPYPFPYSNRDAVVRYESGPGADGGAVDLVARGREEPAIPETARESSESPERRGSSRQATPACRVTYTYLGDLGGKFPGWAAGESVARGTGPVLPGDPACGSG